MSRTSNRSRLRIISDSESDDEVKLVEIKQTSLKTKKDQSVSPSCSPGPSIPQMTFGKIPLTPRKETNFAPSPLKRVEFSSLKVKTPGKKLKGLRFIDTPAKIYEEENVAAEIVDDGVDDAQIGHEEQEEQEQVDLMESLDLGNLRLDDDIASGTKEVICVDVEEEDVDGTSQFSPGPSSPSTKPLNNDPTSPSPAEALSRSPSPRSTTPIIVESDSDESVIWNPTPRRTPGKRRVVVSESESASEAEPSTYQRVLPNFPSTAPGPSSVRKTRGKPAALRFIEEQAYDKNDSEEEVYEEEEDTMGSLRDFIVDDDYDSEEEETSASDQDEDDDNEEVYQSEEAIRSGSEEDSDSDGFEILSPPPPETNKTPNDKSDTPLWIPDISQLVIASSDSDSDSDHRDSDDGRKSNKKKNIISNKGKSDKSLFSNKAWIEERTRIANSIFKELDEKVFENRLGMKGVGARVEWNNRLLTTAGVARIKRITKNGESKKDHWIELSEKVLTGEKQILNTVAHEMCHLATWVISNEFKNPHGRKFKSWGRKVMLARKDIQVTTTHAYQIEYKYQWKCSSGRCGRIYKRHSKSIDTTKHTCGICKGTLVPLFETKQKTASAFQVYLKANMKYAKSSMPGSSHGEVMRALSKRWNEHGENGDHEVFWKSAAIAARS
ncbi:hypothetical protein L486_05180 [Kwoniella mangroviensis CBS 10435]|uniref:SprT-like domain-containing protein n=1 Tax=Kwoniella mangroviensis CBS 10435 TaxID=1331196 RepID=A0A1B9IQ76_9TREE|nr:hypothetical protein L486_05180 [Kwoniella mangroviensis CBS 10435]